MARKIVIIGNNAAGSTAASAARKTDREAEIILVESEKYPAYSRCGLPYVLAGQIKSFDDLIVFPTQWYNMMNLDLRLETNAKEIKPAERTVVIEKDGVEQELHYDSLIIATGGRSFIPSIKGADKEGVYTLRTIDDGRRLQEAMKDAKSAVVIGAGLIGLETAHAFVENHINTTIVEMLPQVCPAMLDWDMASIVAEKIQEHGVKVIVGAVVKEIEGEKHVNGVVISGKDIGERKLDADLVLMATGVRTRTELVKPLGVELGVTGGIKTSADMSTAVPNVYACGDCVESYSLIDWQPTRNQLGTTAVRQAKVAGTNAAGGYSIFPGVLGSSVTKIFGFEVGATGYTELQARRLGYKTVTGSITSRTKAEYYPGGKDIKVKLVVERDLGRVIGGQIVAGEEVTQRVNMLATAIQMHMTVQQLAKTDTCYAPPVNVTIEPVSLAAELAVTRLRRG
ncbi:MAG: FAD-dependent oxidoreductase [Candidatus Bathyarchaeia archaeon]